jgi:CDP-diacylglycerol--serine O-phosphatidyltransferase
MITVTLLACAILLLLAAERLGITRLTGTPAGREWVRNHRLLHPNAISLLRMPMGVVSILFWLAGWNVLAVLWFAFWMITDLTDGTIARNCDLVTESGKWMDPLSDKCLYFPPLIYFAWQGRLPLEWVAAVIVIDSIGQASRLLAAKKAANSFGKTKTALITILLLLTTVERMSDLPMLSDKFLSLLTISCAFLAFLSVYCKIVPDLWYANSLTLANFLCGIGAIWLILLRGQLAFGFMLVFVGQFFDLFDGRLARRFGSTRHGAVFDDIADGTSFGFAIGALILRAIEPFPLAVALAVLHTACVIYRLWRFLRDRSEMPRGVFRGLPSPAGALLAGSSVLVFRQMQPAAWILVVISSGLMISRLPYRHFAQRIWPELPNILKIAGFIMILLFVNHRLTNRNLSGTLELMCFVLAILYVLLGPDRIAAKLVASRLRENQPVN